MKITQYKKKKYESIMNKSALVTPDYILDVIKQDTLLNYIKSIYNDKFDTSMDLSFAINQYCGYMLTNPVFCNIHNKKDMQVIDSVFLIFNGRLYDVYNKKMYDSDREMAQKIKSVKDTEIKRSPSDKSKEIIEMLSNGINTI